MAIGKHSRTVQTREHPVTESAASKSTKTAARAGLTKSQADTAVSAFRLAGDPTRFRILMMLEETPCNVNEICDSLEQAQPAISHHLALLRVSGLISTQRDGKQNYYTLSVSGSNLLDAARVMAADSESR